MDTYFYAQIDLETNICYGISQLSDEIKAPSMIRIDSYNDGLLGKKYEEGVWIPLDEVDDNVMEA